MAECIVAAVAIARNAEAVCEKLNAINDAKDEVHRCPQLPTFVEILKGIPELGAERMGDPGQALNPLRWRGSNQQQS